MPCSPGAAISVQARFIPNINVLLYVVAVDGADDNDDDDGDGGGDLVSLASLSLQQHVTLRHLRHTQRRSGNDVGGAQCKD